MGKTGRGPWTVLAHILPRGPPPQATKVSLLRQTVVSMWGPEHRRPRGGSGQDRWEGKRGSGSASFATEVDRASAPDREQTAVSGCFFQSPPSTVPEPRWFQSTVMLLSKGGNRLSEAPTHPRPKLCSVTGWYPISLILFPGLQPHAPQIFTK